MREIEVSVPASVFNLAGGFGLLGISLDIFHDNIKVNESDEDEVFIGGEYGSDLISYGLDRDIEGLIGEFKSK